MIWQGFNWESSNKGGWYNLLKNSIPDLANAGITHVWLPPPSQSIAPQGMSYFLYCNSISLNWDIICSQVFCYKLNSITYCTSDHFYHLHKLQTPRRKTVTFIIYMAPSFWFLIIEKLRYAQSKFMLFPCLF